MSDVAEDLCSMLKGDFRFHVHIPSPLLPLLKIGHMHLYMFDVLCNASFSYEVIETVIGLCDFFFFQIRKKDQINIETKNKTVRFIGELAKFKMFSKTDTLHCLKVSEGISDLRFDVEEVLGHFFSFVCVCVFPS